MEIKSLQNTSLDEIVECLNEAFKNYFVEMPREVDFWRKRFHAARVDYAYSFGVFDNHKLVGFILHGIDTLNHVKTAFNTGTGVIATHRSLRLVDKIYDYAFPRLKQIGIQKCMLEVIDENHKAIKVYERIGFRKSRYLRCFRGELSTIQHEFTIEKIDLHTVEKMAAPFQKFYSWDNSLQAIHKGAEMFDAFQVSDLHQNLVGYS